MSAQHTPGPWAARDENGKFIDTEWKADNPDAGLTQFAPIHANCTVIALVVREDWNDAQLEADARLIAAAPELLQALQAMVAVFAVGFEPGGSCAVDSARSVIAQATGRAA